MSKSSLPSRKGRVSFESYIADYVILRVLRPYRRAKSFRVIVVLPPGADASVWSEAAYPVLDRYFPRKAMAAADWNVDVIRGRKSLLADATTVDPRHLVLVSADDVFDFDQRHYRAPPKSGGRFSGKGARIMQPPASRNRLR